MFQRTTSTMAWMILFGAVFPAGPARVEARQTTRVSVGSDGEQGNGNSASPSLSADGRFVAFPSHASNLLSGGKDTNGVEDVFVHDRWIGVTTRVSVASDGEQGNGDSGDPSLSADGRFVAFRSHASNLLPEGEDTNGVADVFVHDRDPDENGIFDEGNGVTTRVSVASDGTQGNGHSDGPSLSADGRFVGFGSLASTLVPGDTNNERDVFVYDRQTGRTTRVSVASDGAQGNGNSASPSLSADGWLVAFYSDASNLVSGDTNNERDVFVYDRQTGQTTRVSVASNGAEGNEESFGPSLSADGRFVTFHSHASNLVPGDTNNVQDIFVCDRQTGRTTRVSVDSNGAEGNEDSWYPAITSDGRFVAFHGRASNLVEDDHNGVEDMFIHDRDADEDGVFDEQSESGAIETTRVSVDSDGEQGNNGSYFASLSAGGRFAGFWSEASNLVDNDTNNSNDVFVHDRGRGDCTGDEEFQPPPTCSGGRNLIRVAMSRGVPGQPVVFYRNDGAPRERFFNNHGKAKAKWKNSPTGPNEISAELACGVMVSQMVECDPPPCTGRERFKKLTCSDDGRNVIRATMMNGAPGQPVIFYRNGVAPRSRVFNTKGKAKAKWKNSPTGPNEISAELACGDVVAQTADCP